MLMIFMTAMHLNKTKLSIALLLVISFTLRILPIFANHIFFWFDQGMDMVLVKQFAADHTITLTSRYSGLAGVLMGPFWTWILAVPFVLGGGNPAAIVIFFSAVCVLSILLTYIFIKKNFNPYSAIFVLVFLCFAPIYTYGSNVASSPHPLIFIFILFIWFAYEIFARKKAIFFAPFGLLVGLLFQFEIGFAIFSIPVILLLIIGFKSFYLFKNKYFYLGLVLGLLTFVPQLLFDMRHNYLISKSIINLFTGRSNSLYGSSESLPGRFSSRLGSFREDFETFALFIKPWYLSLILLCLSLYGWFLIFKNKLAAEVNLGKILLIILLGYFLGFSLYPGPIWTWYRLGLSIVYILLLIFPLGVLWKKARPLGLLAIVILTFGIHQAISGIGVEGIIKNSPIEDNAVLQNQLSAIDYVYSQANGKPFSYYAYTPPVYDYLWQYHFFWYAQKKYGYLPNNFHIGIPLLGTGMDVTPPKENEGLFFLIMEPDRERPWQINGWKKTFIKIGKVISTSRFPGDIIVEERTTN